MIGAFVGAFLIVVVYEMYLHGNFNAAVRAGCGTFLGQMAGMVLKFVLSIAMIVAVALATFLRSPSTAGPDSNSSSPDWRSPSSSTRT